MSTSTQYSGNVGSLNGKLKTTKRATSWKQRLPLNGLQNGNYIIVKLSFSRKCNFTHVASVYGFLSGGVSLKLTTRSPGYWYNAGITVIRPTRSFRLLVDYTATIIPAHTSPDVKRIQCIK